jgi:hypothetical protein
LCQAESLAIVPGTIPIASIVADSAEATGLKWQAPASGGGMTLLATHTLSGTTSTISGISTSYVKLIAYVFGITNSSTNADLYVNPNGSSVLSDALYSAANNGGWSRDTNAAIPIATGPAGQGLVFNNSDNAFTCVFDNYSDTTAFKSWVTYGGGSDSSGKRGYLNSGIFRSSSAITSLGFRYSGYTMNGGTVLLYGVK